MSALTELGINRAAVELVLPVVGEAARQLHLPGQALLVAATLAASCAFMLPVATAPNAIVYGTGRVSTGQMVRAGLWLNGVAALVVVLLVSLLGGG